MTKEQLLEIAKIYKVDDKTSFGKCFLGLMQIDMQGGGGEAKKHYSLGEPPTIIISSWEALEFVRPHWKSVEYQARKWELIRNT